MNKIAVVAGILLTKQKDIYLAKRQLWQDHAGMWEFPGGKLLPHEGHFVALKRELFEELAINLISQSLVKFYQKAEYIKQQSVIMIDFYLWQNFSEEIYSNEGQELGKFHFTELLDLSMPPLDKKIARQLYEDISNGIL